MKLNSKYLTLALPLILVACGGGGGDTPTTQTPPAGDDPNVTPPTSSADNFSFGFDRAFINNTTTGYQNFITTNIGDSVQPLNQIDNVFRNTSIPVTYKDCGFANAFYSPSERSIVLCDELTDVGFGYFLSQNSGNSQAERDNAVFRAVGMMSFVLYHEIGHALDDIRDLGVGGNFESVADAIGVVLSVQTGQPLAAIDGGAFFLSDTQASFADEHGNGEDRAGDILCWTLGSSSRVSALFQDLSNLYTQAGRDCVAEYANQYDFVSQLVPNLRNIPPKSSLRSKSDAATTEMYARMDKWLAENLDIEEL